MLQKITSVKEKEKKQQRLQIFFAVFMVAVLGVSTASFALFSADSESQKYDDRKFYLTENGWQGKDLDFTAVYLPQEVENISLEGGLSLNQLSNKVYIISSNPLRSISYELYEWGNAVPMGKVNAACLPENGDLEECTDLPLKDCNDGDLSTAILIFRDSNETGVESTGNCIEIKGDDSSMLKAVDRAIYALYGVIA